MILESMHESHGVKVGGWVEDGGKQDVRVKVGGWVQLIGTTDYIRTWLAL